MQTLNRLRYNKTMSNHFETAITNVLGINNRDVKPTPAMVALVSLAYEIDRLNRELIEDSTWMARRFTDYAIQVSEGFNGTSPAGSSTMLRIAENTAACGVRKDMLFTMMRVTCDKETVEKFKKVLNDSYKGVRTER